MAEWAGAVIMAAYFLALMFGMALCVGIYVYRDKFRFIFDSLDPVVGGLGVLASAGIPELGRSTAENRESDIASNMSIVSPGRALGANVGDRAPSPHLEIMSHEVRTPMNAVMAAVELLSGTDLNTYQRGLVEILAGASGNLLSAISDILDVASLSSGALNLELLPFDLDGCVNSAVETVESISKESNVEWRHESGAADTTIFVGDEARIRQVLVNLLAWVATFAGPRTVSLIVNTGEDKRVGATAQEVATNQKDVAESQAVEHVEFSVAIRDSAAEILSDMLAEFFVPTTPFAAQPASDGDLRMSICRHLVQLMGGKIWIDGEKGSDFAVKVAIPLYVIPSPLQAFHAQPSALLEGKRLFVADSDDANRWILHALGTSWQMIVRSTGSVGTVQEWIHRGDPFDVVLLEARMLEDKGASIARDIRRYHGADHLPVILLGADDDHDTHDHDVKDEVDSTFGSRVEKPVVPNQLHDTLVHVLANGNASESATESASEAAEDPESLRILIAEDNETNQKIALWMLESLGYSADVAVNGVEALVALRENTYDVVLMDVHMPEMDGLEATRRIHHEWKLERPYIVAMTANATEQDRMECTAAGMDEYISKPVSKKVLQRVLSEYRAHPVLAVPDVPQESVSPDENGMGAIRSTVMKLYGDFGSERGAHLVDTFLGATPQRLIELRTALELGDAKTVERITHTIKSNGRTFGDVSLEKLAERAEALSREESLDAMPGLLDQIERRFWVVKDILGKIREEFA